MMNTTYKAAFDAACARLDTFTPRMVPVVIDVIMAENGFELQRSTNNHSGRVTFKILWDGECISYFDNEKEAYAMFKDFVPDTPKKRGRKAKA